LPDVHVLLEWSISEPGPGNLVQKGKSAEPLYLISHEQQLSLESHEVLAMVAPGE
jgi:hypothetical protein